MPKKFEPRHGFHLWQMVFNEILQAHAGIMHGPAGYLFICEDLSGNTFIDSEGPIERLEYYKHIIDERIRYLKEDNNVAKSN